MKSFFRLSIVITAAAFLFSSCSKKNDEGKMIPNNAMFVIHLNTKSLKDKLTWDDVKQTSWYKQAYSDTATKGWMKKLMDNPENSGIDLNRGLIFFAQKNAGTDGEMVLEGTVKSSSEFAAFNKNLDFTATVKKDGDLNMLTLKDASVVTWNDNHFAYVFDAASASKFYPGNNAMGTQSNMTPLTDRSAALSAVGKNLFSLKEDSTLAKNERFTDLLKENGDMHAWVNTEELMKNSPSMGALGMLKLDVFLKDNISTYTVNFDNGKVVVDQKGYAGKEFSDFLEKYSGGSVNTDMIKTIPSQNVMGVLSINFKPEGIKELLKLTGMDGFINMYAGQMGFSIDDFVKANKGDVMLALTDLKMKTDSFSYRDTMGNATSSNTYSKPDMNFIFAVSINDKPSFKKLIDAGKKITSQMGKNDTSIAYGQNDKIFAISNQQHFLNDYISGNSGNKFDFLDKINGQPIGMFIDIHKILSTISTQRKESADNEVIMNESLKLWNNLYFTAGKFKDGGVTGHSEINFIDQSTNSLKQLNHYFDVIAKIEMAKRDSVKASMHTTDSLMIPPPMDTVGHK